eukprot:sb/3466651/
MSIIQLSVEPPRKEGRSKQIIRNPHPTPLISLCCVHISCTTLAAILHTTSLHTLELTPSHFFTGSLWQPVTAGFTDTSLIALILVLVLVVLSSRFLEPVWGGFEYVKFCVLVNTSAYTVNLLIYLIGYIAVREEKFLYAPFSGSHALSAGLLVGIKQLIPDHVIFKQFPALRVRHLPLCLFGWCVLLTVLRVCSTRYFTVTAAGFAAAWVYLRYFQARESGRGDLSDALSLASFFPESAQPQVLQYSTAMINVVDGMMRKGAPGGQTNDQHAGPAGPIVDDPVAERRKHLALQALNERLQRTTLEPNPPSTSQPTATEEVQIEKSAEEIV